MKNFSKINRAFEAKKKIYAIFAAMMVAMTMSAALVQQDIDMSKATWGWGYNSTVTEVTGGLQTELTKEWGALSTGWNPEIDLTQWDKIVIVVESMEGCSGTWFKLKAYLRDKSESEPNQMEGLLGLDAEDNAKNYLVIDLKQEKAGFDLTKARILAIQCQPQGAKFVISKAYFEKGSETAVENVSVKNNGIRYNLLGQEVSEDYKGIVIMNGQKMIVR